MRRCPEFRKRLDREIRLRIREMKDGCVECLLTRRGLCSRHEAEALELIVKPRKTIALRSPRKN